MLRCANERFNIWDCVEYAINQKLWYDDGISTTENNKWKVISRVLTSYVMVQFDKHIWWHSANWMWLWGHCRWVPVHKVKLCKKEFPFEKKYFKKII